MDMSTMASSDHIEESSYARLKRMGNMDNAQVSRSVYASNKSSPHKSWNLTPILVLLITLLVYTLPILPLNPLEHSCLAVLVGSALCWATEIIPSYITAYIALATCVWLNVGFDSTTGTRIQTSTLATILAAKLMDPVILVFLGSMTMSAALTKLEITDRVSSFLLSKISPKPKIILASLMLLNFIISTFLSNIASTTLTLTFSLPIIRALDPEDPFATGLLLGLAWSGNAGGLPSTISSPQNIMAIKYINTDPNNQISFLAWLGFGVPTGLVTLVAFFVYIVLYYKPRLAVLPEVSLNKEFAAWTWRHTFACVVTVLTIILWSINDTLKHVLGHVGITSLIPVVLFFSIGILDSQDFGSLRWSTLVVMGGGLALGEAMNVSGLLKIISGGFSESLEKISLWVLVVIVCFIEAILTSIINHTSAAAILYPVLAGIGEAMNAKTRIIALSALMISSAQLFHISSFPNALISGVQKHSRVDPTQMTSETYITGKTFFLRGWPMAILSVFIVSSVGYGLVNAMGYN